MAKSAVAVVGAGIIGCLVARELATRGAGTPVTLLDRDAVGAGASRRSAGLHLPRGASVRIQRMSGYSHAYYADLAREHPEMPIYPTGATVVARPELIGQYLPQAAPERIGKLAAVDVSVPPGLGVWRIAGSHYCDVHRLTQALALQLRPRVEVLEGVTVTGLLPGADSVTVRCGTGARLTVGGVILSPGPWLAAPAWRDLLAPLGMRVKRIVALHIARQPTPADEVILFDSDDAFLLPAVHRGHWLFSYSCREWDVDPDTPMAGLTAAHLRAARDCLRRYSPELADACSGGQLFCDAYSLDGEPVVRALDQAGRIVFAGAAGGSGYRLGPAIAAEAVDLLAHQSLADLSLADLSLADRSEGVTGDRKYV
jgi:glycine/D-amino acid oxidase-like deaminating enzyme